MDVMVTLSGVVRRLSSSGQRPNRPATRTTGLLRSDHPWFQGKEFTKDWVTNKLELWKPVLEELRDRPASVLEVGSYEGRSATAFLEMLPLSKITCVDHFSRPEVEGRFDRNMASYGERVTKRKGKAIPVLDQLVSKGRQYDLIYLDAAKDRTGALVVSVLGWHLCRVGGAIIWDDLSWQKTRQPSMRPEPGSRHFINTFASCMDIRFNANQCIAWKTADWPEVAKEPPPV